MGALNLTGTTAAAIADNGSYTCGVTKVGTGLIALNAANTFSGPITVNAGILQGNGRASGNSLGSTAGGVTLVGGTLKAFSDGGANNVVAPYIYGGSTMFYGWDSGTKRLANVTTVAWPGAGSSTTAIVSGALGNGPATVGGVYHSAGSPNSYTGTITNLSGGVFAGFSGGNRNALTGPVTIAGGVLYVMINGSQDGALGPTSNPVVLNGGVLQFRYSRTFNYPITVSPAGGTIQEIASGVYTPVLAGNITGSGTLTFAGNGSVSGDTLTLSGAGNSWSGGAYINSFSGATISVNNTSSMGTGPVTVNSGTLTLNGDANIATHAALTVASGATANFKSASPSIGSLSGAGGVVLGVSGGQVTTLNIGGANSNTTFSGVISEAAARKGNLTKIGAGTQTLSGTNTYTGPTTISNGTLLVSGSLSTGSVTVATTGTLGGSGTIGGAVTNYGTLSPGASVGTLTVGQLTMASNSVAVFELGAASTAYDKIVVTSNLTFEAGATVQVVPQRRFGAGEYTLFTCGGTPGSILPTFLPMAGGYAGRLTVVSNSVVLMVGDAGTVICVR